MILVLDSSALLAVSFREIGADRVDAMRNSAALSSVSLAEMIAKLLEGGVSLPDARATVGGFGVTVHDFTAEHAEISGRLLPLTRSRGLSLGDRCCLALAIALKGSVLTADRAWEGLDVGVPIDVIR